MINEKNRFNAEKFGREILEVKPTADEPYDNKGVQGQKRPAEIRGLLEKIRSIYRQVVGNIGGRESETQLINNLQGELAFVEKEAVRDGVDFSRCQMDEVVGAYNNGHKVEFESFSPYLADYYRKTGEIWKDKLTPADAIGVKVGRVLREAFPKARVISLYDEYNTNRSDKVDSFGKPMAGGRQLDTSDEVKENFKKNVKEVLTENEVIKEGDKEGENYLFVSESSKISEAEELVKQLNELGNIKYEGEAIYFSNPNADNPAYREIPLRTRGGRWLCEALDSSSFLKPENLEIVHLVVLPNYFKEQQDKVWEILRVLGIKPDNYHNIFFDEKVPSQKVVSVVGEEIGKYKK